MLDKLPTEIISTELVKFCDKSSTLNLTKTCKFLNQATIQHLNKTYKFKPTLINYDNPMFYDEDRYMNYKRDQGKLYKDLFFVKPNTRYGQSLKIRNNYRSLVRNLQNREKEVHV